MTSFSEIRENYRLLDAMSLANEGPERCLTYEDFPVRDDERLPPPSPEGFAALAWARKMLERCGRADALLLNQVDRGAQWACILNALRPARYRKKIILYDVFIDTPHLLKRALIGLMVRGATVSVVFSRCQVEGYQRRFNLRAERFIYVPYQSSHSKRPPVVMDESFEIPDGEKGALTVEPGRYVFAGGNSAREYHSLCAAAEITGIPVIICTTRNDLLAACPLPSCVQVVSVQEPHFTRLMAASRFVVLPLSPGRVRGYGEQTILNSFWHGRPVIAMDDISASDYIRDGIDGRVLAPQDSEGLIQAMRQLWDDPETCMQMGQQAQQRVRDHFSHDHFVHRLTALTRWIGRRTLDSFV